MIKFIIGCAVGFVCGLCFAAAAKRDDEGENESAEPSEMQKSVRHIEAANSIKKYCGSISECRFCCFGNTEGGYTECILKRDIPESWEVAKNE